MAERVVTVHIPVVLAREVDRIADRLERPLGWVVKEALTRYVELDRKRYELTREALDDVIAGRVVDSARVEAWATKVTGSARKSRR